MKAAEARAKAECSARSPLKGRKAQGAFYVGAEARDPLKGRSKFIEPTPILRNEGWGTHKSKATTSKASPVPAIECNSRSLTPLANGAAGFEMTA